MVEVRDLLGDVHLRTAGSHLADKPRAFGRVRLHDRALVGREAARFVQDRHRNDALADIVPARRHLDQAAGLLVHPECLGDFARHRADAEHVIAGGVVIQFRRQCGGFQELGARLGEHARLQLRYQFEPLLGFRGRVAGVPLALCGLEVPFMVHLQQGGTHATVDGHDLVHVERRYVRFAGELVAARGDQQGLAQLRLGAMPRVFHHSLQPCQADVFGSSCYFGHAFGT